jgi:glycine hydroxymethyltransferase
MKDPEIQHIMRGEDRRQRDTLTLIPSENYASEDVLAALGSPLTNKYAEGYSLLRYYPGNSYVDELEDLTKDRARKVFRLSDSWGVNVQPYSGSVANLAVCMALVPPGGTIMGLGLDMGGHLSHGYKVNVSGKFWKAVQYTVNARTGKLDYAAIEREVRRVKPALIIAGSSAYPRTIDFKEFARIARVSGAHLLADISHVAGLVAGGVHPSPFPYADAVMTTTHKTLRGPRAAVIFSRDADVAKKIDRAVFPGLQGGPHMNAIAAMAVAFREAQQPAFKKYAARIVRNARVLADTLKAQGWKLSSGGTDTHLILMDVRPHGLRGKEASELLEAAGLLLNKNAIPYDPNPPTDPSGLRFGTPAVTSRGMKEPQMKVLALLIDRVLTRKISVRDARTKVRELARRFPIPKHYLK